MGIPRSGTTLLERSLNAHPEIAVCPESMVFGHIYRYGADVSTKDEWINRSILMDSGKWLSNYNTSLNEILREKLSDLEYSKNTLHEILCNIAGKFASGASARLIGEKTPDHLYYIDTITEFCPDHKFIVIQRDPFDCVYSIAKAINGRSNSGIPCKVLFAASGIVKQGESVIKLLRKKDDGSILYVWYEDLVTSPSEQFRRDTFLPWC